MQMRNHAMSLGLLGGLAVVFGSGTAGAQTDINFTLDWAYQGPTSAIIAAEALGYFEEEGLSVTIDSGSGSAGAVTRVASGAYQMGFADINALVEFTVENPDQTVKAVFMVYDAPPFGLYTLKSSGIETPEDLVGRTLGAPVFDASYKLFPAFAAEVGIDEAAVPRVNMDPPLREAMLIQGEVDVISGHYFSSMLDLQSRGVAEEDIVYMLYADHGMDFYGNAVIASGEFIESNPAAVAGFNRAVAKAMQFIIENREEAVAMVAEYDPLIDQELEVRRLGLAIDVNIDTDYTRANGFGGVDPDRLANSIAQLATALKLENPPTADDIWTDAFLPDAELRQFP
jgi:NitT/TauT family transport system substrate-binding protein